MHWWHLDKFSLECCKIVNFLMFYIGDHYRNYCVWEFKKSLKECVLHIHAYWRVLIYLCFCMFVCACECAHASWQVLHLFIKLNSWSVPCVNLGYWNIATMAGKLQFSKLPMCDNHEKHTKYQKMPAIQDKTYFCPIF